MSARLEPGSPEWLTLVTPSKIPAILGLSPYCDPYTQYHIMRGTFVQEETDEMRRGNFHEEGVLREFFHRHPTWTRLPDSNVTIRVNAWFAVTPDALALDENGDLVLVEAKTAAYLDEYGEPGTDEVPEHYFAQVICSTYGAKAVRWALIVLGPFWEYHEYGGPADTALAEATLAACYPFWLAVQSGDEPELSHTASSYDTWTKVTDDGCGDGQLVIDRALAARFLAAVAGEKQIKPCKAELVNVLGDAKEAVYDGKVVARKQRNSVGGISVYAGRNPPVITDEPTINEWETV